VPLSHKLGLVACKPSGHDGTFLPWSGTPYRNDRDRIVADRSQALLRRPVHGGRFAAVLLSVLGFPVTAPAPAAAAFDMTFRADRCRAVATSRAPPTRRRIRLS